MNKKKSELIISSTVTVNYIENKKWVLVDMLEDKYNFY